MSALVTPDAAGTPLRRLTPARNLSAPTPLALSTLQPELSLHITSAIVPLPHLNTINYALE